jgi:hypothetical protein
MTHAAERFLADFHDRPPGGPSAAFGTLRLVDDQGHAHASPYRALADRGRPLLGVDIGTGEPAAARKRLDATVPLPAASRRLTTPLHPLDRPASPHARRRLGLVHRAVRSAPFADGRRPPGRPSKPTFAAGCCRTSTTGAWPPCPTPSS